ncbi:hypothetical protein CLOSYM_04673 [[Clostridium] symbiosum ATCC 14940]|uniref:Uncharacterized protein n=1 Tax=[Clostridium] symbiosum ATCC 14940 TaxID=411472 RepID=A0ABC9TR32_CLOSY|nr:hypothetical protein CLOSYM_04673 [[Clostridium] symbiosum ATCC 14940]
MQGPVLKVYSFFYKNRSVFFIVVLIFYRRFRKKVFWLMFFLVFCIF